jgi:hypothetical protein
MPFESMVAAGMGGMSEGALNFTLRSMLWIHVLIVLGFLNYLPSSKHLHLLGAVPNIFFAKLGPTAALPTPDLEQEDLEVFGASEPKHFHGSTCSTRRPARSAGAARPTARRRRRASRFRR